jgi:hypothetical protein
VAWVVALGGDGLIIDGIFLRRTQAEEACAWRNEHTTYGARIIPLHEKPQPTLTDEEREALWCAVCDYNSMTRTLDMPRCGKIGPALASLFERLK